MRWAGQTLDAADDGALPGLERAGLVRSVQTPEFEGITFHEVLCKSALNKIDGDSLPFSWTVNPARGCSHACTYCFARPTHEYLDLDAGSDFDSQIVVKTNIAAVLRKELARKSWKREPVALGTNTDPYQRAEGRYRLMPGIIGALAESGTPFSILTKGTLLRRDLPLLALASRQVDVHINISLAIHDAGLQKQIEPGTPSPKARLDLIRAVRDVGLPCGVLVAPVIPFLTDGARQLESLIQALADAGATSVSAMPMHLRSSTKDWFMSWLAEQHPALVRRYRQLYGHGAYVTPEYKTWLRGRIDPMLERHGFDVGDERSMPKNFPAESSSSTSKASDPALTLF
ncbi:MULTISPECIES: Rv2578c family radical SAM protein [Nocardiaceae]|uniref:Rv2578c family radical SAM protein n=1 Tax=Nocardiaceae TaxID=85025 RepID=UPI00055CE392|nr:MULTISPECIES: Rv2578c family radical SAM protein [Rhodococcus]OZE94536.1 radical SAM protein [Rhodococcus sp. 15-1189-1-1a]OZF09620.1 radical SAM protein [Rhodococcus sp. 14-2686-1-2]OZF44027.1 radical SAM protein [Rhodococcus sp. 14-2470-1b]